MEANKHYMWRTNPDIAISQFIKSNVAVTVTNDLGRIIYANDRFCKIVGCEERDLIGFSNSLFLSPTTEDLFYKKLWKTIENGHVWKGVLSNKTKNGELFWLETTIVPLKDNEGVIESFVAMYIDITRSRVEYNKIDRVEYKQTS